MARRKALVTGANGFVGSHLVEELLARGRSVAALVRPTSDLAFLDPRAGRVFGDVTRPTSLPPALAGVDEVYHVAGTVSARRIAAFAEVNEEGARSLMRAVHRAAPGLRRFVLVSSLAAAGPSRDGRPVREDHRPRPVSAYGRSKLGGERAVREAARGVPLTIVRPPIVYGPRDTGILSFFRMVERGRVPRFRPDKLHSWIHVHDLVRGIVDAADAEVAAGRTYHLAEARAWSSSAALALVAGTIGARPRAVTVPEPLLRLLAPVADALAGAFGLRLRPLADKHREILARFWLADTERARRELGFRSRIGLPEGLRGAAEFYRRAGWIGGASGRMGN